jgi:hypothetical protein
MKRLILVHGRSQQDLDPITLKRKWIEVLNRGLEAVNLTLPPIESVRFPYYGDTLIQLCNGLSPQQAAAVVLRGEVTNIEERNFLREVIIEAAEKFGIDENQALAELSSSELDRGIQNWPVVLAFARLLSRVPGIDVETLSLVTHDVYQYLSNPGISRFIDEGVKEAFSPGIDTVVVSHSLGTLVAYRILRDLDQSHKVVHLITLGSPLAIPTIQEMLAPLRRPACVINWSNARDPRDVVALYPLAPPNFPLQPVLDKSDVANFTDNHHGIAGYLEDPAVSRWIHEALL